jgi:NAD-dependent dihydropyrimidine dehydrogenase PreA subunit
VMTHDEIEEFIDGLPEGSEIAVGPCRCREANHVCDHPLETDIVILTGAHAWKRVFSEYRFITKEEALKITRECSELGMVHNVMRHMHVDGHINYFAICNCCGCACIPILGYKRYKGDPYFSTFPSAYKVSIDRDKCEGCGTCTEVCAYGERKLVGEKSMVLDCQGCGVCARFCPSGASVMVKAGEVPDPFLAHEEITGCLGGRACEELVPIKS